MLFVYILLIAFKVQATPGAPTPIEFQALMKLDYNSFDQTLPDGGSRAILDHVDAGKTLDAYLVHNFDSLLEWQRVAITWHAGQAYAKADLTELGIARFKKSYAKDKPADDKSKWNAYVRGSIAFLEHNEAELKQARDEVVNADAKNVNGKVLDGFLRCFTKTYREAYQCR
jgi:hypothetical protein